MKLQFWKMRQTVLEIFILVNLFRSYRGFSHFGWQDRTGQNLHADGLYHEPASKCNFDLNRQNTLLLNLFGTIGRKNTTLDGMYHMLLVTVYYFVFLTSRSVLKILCLCLLLNSQVFSSFSESIKFNLETYFENYK